VGRASVTDSLIDKSFVVPDYALIWEKKFTHRHPLTLVRWVKKQALICR
jgi:hypothetical protein